MSSAGMLHMRSPHQAMRHSPAVQLDRERHNRSSHEDVCPSLSCSGCASGEPYISSSRMAHVGLPRQVDPLLGLYIRGLYNSSRCCASGRSVIVSYIRLLGAPYHQAVQRDRMGYSRSYR